jgi:hypothetical protein
MVRCSTCGVPHEEYLGPPDRDERGAEMELLRRELAAAAAILFDHSKSGVARMPRKRRKTPVPSRRSTAS